MCVATMHRLNYSEQQSEKQFAVCDSDIPVILKKGQDYYTWYKLQDREQGHDLAKFEILPLNSVCKKANITVFAKSENTSVISFEYVQK